jgi:hypothetical protein
MGKIVRINQDFNESASAVKNKVSDIMNSYFVKIPVGDYEATFTHYYTCNIKGTDKVVFLFTIVDFGDYHNVIIPRFYAVKRLIGKKGLKGRFIPKCSPNAAFIKDYYAMYPTAPRLRPDRVPMSKLQSSPYINTVGDVGKNDKQIDHIEQIKYSVVREVKLNQ